MIAARVVSWILSGFGSWARLAFRIRDGYHGFGGFGGVEGHFVSTDFLQSADISKRELSASGISRQRYP